MELVEIPKLVMSEADTSVLQKFQDLEIDTKNIKLFLTSIDSIDFSPFEKALSDNEQLGKLKPLPVGIVQGKLAKAIGRSTFI